jgi:hypothetical protein
MQKETDEDVAAKASTQLLEFLKFKVRDLGNHGKILAASVSQRIISRWLHQVQEIGAEAYAHNSRIIAHAEREFSLLPKPENTLDQTYQSWLQEAALELLFVFSKQGHSGGTAADLLALFNRLAEQEALTPITDNPAEWEDMSVPAGYPFWQNKRSSRFFSTDGGKTYFDCDNTNGQRNEPIISHPYQSN